MWFRIFKIYFSTSRCSPYEGTLFVCILFLHYFCIKSLIILENWPFCLLGL